MAKKTVKKNTKAKDRCIRPALYWEYRCTLEELKVATLEQKRKILERDNMRKDMEIQQLKLVAFSKTIQNAAQSKVEAEKELARIRDIIESEVGMELKNCVIDEVTYEVRTIDEPLI
jgi:hypothetical protein